jgi:transcriptional regulator with XRE-family HTH domain
MAFVRNPRDDNRPPFSHDANVKSAHRQRWFLKEWREYRQLSQQKLGELIDSSKGYISELETGGRRYNQDLLENLARALCCQPGDLISLDPSVPGVAEDAAKWRAMKPNRRRQVIKVLEALAPEEDEESH